jgi:hypothetical protein
VILPSSADTSGKQAEPEMPLPPATEKQPEEKPETAPGLVVPPAKRPAARPPAKTVEEPPPPENASSKHAPPRMSPNLTPAQKADYERRTREALAAAEKDLQKSYGRRLNTTQTDLVEKIRTFLGQSREAMRADDWVRALNLADKARTLAAELAATR